MIRIKRVYDQPVRADGLRILVERLWPRGVSREKAAVELWLKDLAPSTELRQWFSHDREKWTEFCRRYAAELSDKGDLLTLLKHRSEEGPVTLIFSARDETQNSAVALKAYLERLP